MQTYSSNIGPKWEEYVEGRDRSTFIREAYKILKGQVKPKVKPTMESKPWEGVKEEEVTSRKVRPNDVADMKARVHTTRVPQGKVWNKPPSRLAEK